MGQKLHNPFPNIIVLLLHDRALQPDIRLVLPAAKRIFFSSLMHFSLVGFLRGVTSKIHRKLAPPEGRQHDPKAKTSSRRRTYSAQSNTLRFRLPSSRTPSYTTRDDVTRGSSSLSLSLTHNLLHLWCARSPTQHNKQHPPANFSLLPSSSR